MAPSGPHANIALVVEDDCGSSELGAAMLAEFGLDVVSVRSAEAAIAHLVQCAGRVRLVLAGNCAGDMKGDALARRIGVLWPTVSVIVTPDGTASRDHDRPARATYLPKSWHPLEMVSIAERAARADHSVHSLAL